jgi:hypothetical protein
MPGTQIPNAILMPGTPASLRPRCEGPMDIVMILLVAALALLSWGLVRLCEKV